MARKLVAPRGTARRELMEEIIPRPLQRLASGGRARAMATTGITTAAPLRHANRVGRQDPVPGAGTTFKVAEGTHEFPGKSIAACCQPAPGDARAPSQPDLPCVPRRCKKPQRAPCPRAQRLEPIPLASSRIEHPPRPVVIELLEADGRERFGLDTHPNQLEIITAEQMMDAYASVGMPVNYRHWSYGKGVHRHREELQARPGAGLRDRHQQQPRISYLMEENTMAMQALVIAHAAYGHNSFFRGNHLFRMWTDAASIIDYLASTRRTTSPAARNATASTPSRNCSTAATR